ncbi:ankyrin repeat domain-containing protein [bacterium]|jgi:ankyrin repeat protein|nr:ankyrin repeat domain-containing protein [bacterium]
MIEMWFNAIYSSYFRTIKKLIKSGIDINMKNPISSNRDSAIMEACIQNNIILIDLLIDNGADVNFKNDYNDTPLHFCKGFIDASKMLIESGADLTNINNFNQSILKN